MFWRETIALQFFFFLQQQQNNEKLFLFLSQWLWCGDCGVEFGEIQGIYEDAFCNWRVKFFYVHLSRGTGIFVLERRKPVDHFIRVFPLVELELELIELMRSKMDLLMTLTSLLHGVIRRQECFWWKLSLWSFNEMKAGDLAIDSALYP